MRLTMPDSHVHSKARVSGFVVPGFEEIRAEFERNFEERGEIGAAVAAHWRGEKVVDLWGGRIAPSCSTGSAAGRSAGRSATMGTGSRLFIGSLEFIA
jgi:hypothetical protein